MNGKLILALLTIPLISVAATSVAHACSPYGLIGAKYSQKPELGPCLDDEHDDGAGGRIQEFQWGRIDWDGSASQAYEVFGSINAEYNAMGLAAGFGHPGEDETASADGRSRYNYFTNGKLIIWSPSTGAHALYGQIGDRWEELGHEFGELGDPTSDEGPDGSGGEIQYFEGGTIGWHPDASVGSTIAEIGSTEISFEIPTISFGGGDPVGSSQPLIVTLFSNGSYIFSGGFHSSSDFTVETVNTAVAVRGSNGDVLTFSQSGSLNVANRTFSWNNSGSNPTIAAMWTELETGVTFNANSSTSIGAGTLLADIEAAFSFIKTVVSIV